MHKRKPTITDPASWSHADDPRVFGRSPAMMVLDELKRWNDLPPDERAKAAAEWVKRRIDEERGE